MPFITQGKTNWKFLLIVVVLAIVVDGVIWWFWNQNNNYFCNTDSDCENTCCGCLPIKGKGCNRECFVLPERECKCIDGQCVAEQEESKDETADWQTYRNEEYRFEIRYPKWWNIYELNGQILFQDTPLEDIPNEWFSINTKNDEYDFSSYDFSKEEIVDKITGKEEINISNVNGFRYTFYPKSELYILRKYIILNYKGRGWILSYSGLSPGLESQMLSTFKFLE